MSAQHMELAKMAFRSLSEKDRTSLLKELAGTTPEPQPARLVRRGEVARRLSCSVRLVDLLARSGSLTRVRLPGRQRGNGFLESEVSALIAGNGGAS